MANYKIIDYPASVGEGENDKDVVLSVRNLSISFKTDEGMVQAVRGVSFDLHKEETLCIVGESGSGKSVTNKTIMGILPKSARIESGSIIYEGEDLTQISEDEFHNIRGTKIGMIFQDPLSSLNPIMRIGKQITEVMLINGHHLQNYFKELTNEEYIKLKNDERLLALAKNAFKQKKADIAKRRKNAMKLAKASESEFDPTPFIDELNRAKSEFESRKNELKSTIDEDKKAYNVAKKEAKIKVKARKAEWVVEHKTNLKPILRSFFDMKETKKAIADIQAENARYKAYKSDPKNAVKEDDLIDLYASLVNSSLNAFKDAKAELESAKKALNGSSESKVAYNSAKLAYRDAKKAYDSACKDAKAKVYQKKFGARDEHRAILKPLVSRLLHFPDFSDAYERFLLEHRRYLSKHRVTHREAKERALKIMAEVGIPQPERRFYQYPFEFSGGMRQRIVIAIALTAHPDILICDEPTTALDVTIQAQILELINELKAKHHMSVIFITHDLGVVANMADRVAVMYAGKIVEYGKAEEVFYKPAHPYTWALLSSIPDVDSKEKLEAIPGTPPNMLFPPKGDAFALRSKYAMGIDFKEEPPMFELSPTHYAATWLLDPRSPKTEMPTIVSTRIKNSLSKAKKASTRKPAAAKKEAKADELAKEGGEK